MKSTNVLGEFEQIVLLAVLRLGDNAYGVTIGQEIVTCGKRTVSPGALYTTLDRLEEKANLTSRQGEASAIRGGRAKRYYTVTKQGKERLAAAQETFQRMLTGLQPLRSA